MLLSSFPLISVCHCVNISNSFWYRNFDFVGTIWYLLRDTCLFQDVIRNTEFFVIDFHNAQSLYGLCKTLFILYFIFSIATDLSENVIYLFYFNFI
jgi:hypothetical protein